MDGDPAGGTRLIQKFKLKLIDALSGDADFVLQHCHSLSLLSDREYDQVKPANVPSEKVRDILDYVMRKDSRRVQIFLNLLKNDEMQETFSKLSFLKDLPLSKPPTAEKRKMKREETMLEEEVPPKQTCKTSSSSSSRMVTEKQLMLVSRHIGRNWKELARVDLELSSTRLEQIEEENLHSHRERVFSALRAWSMRERDRATPTRLHSLLTQEENAVTPGSLDFLLEEN
ncbi:ankyrin-1 [Astyanax mexicanus]|uniref:ankyrin-1 n=1 Tax=Astyanax mexicanus TaxID=7994 RepID=UPI0020CACA27|nr:ankyrin-1 [Astyanax mexicanus]XP_022532783.2 ankyrin-1 [Astyanax mexicanus]